MHDASYQAALKYVEDRYGIPLEQMLFKKLIMTINGVRNSAERGAQYDFEESFREALNQLGFTDHDTRERYKSGAGKYFSSLKAFRRALRPEQVSLVGTVTEEADGQFRFTV